MNKAKTKIGIAVLGAGARGIQVTGNLLRDSNRGVEILSVFDPDERQCRAALKEWDSPEAKICDTFEEAIATEGVSWVMVLSPNVFHREQVVAGFEAGHHVFSEKPLATSIEDCIAIHEAHQKSGKYFTTGFVLRYAPIYRKLKTLLEEGVVGQVLSIDANENLTPEHGAFIMMNWRRHTDWAGPHILEKCCHDLDLLYWYTGSVPNRVAAFHGRNFFVPANDRLMEKYGRGHWTSLPDLDRADDATPFTDDTDLMDNLVSIMEFRNGVRAQFQATMSNQMPERRIYISGSEGNAMVELYTGTLRYQRMGEKKPTSMSYYADGHGDGDADIMKELYETMANGVPPNTSAEEGLYSAVVALAIDQSAREGRIIDLAPTWSSLGVE